MSKTFPAFAAILILAISSVGIFRAQQLVWPVSEEHFYELGLNPGYVPDGKELKPAILGFDNFVADLYWLKTVQYAGGHAGVFEFTALPEYLHLVTDLDPHFGYAYTFGALVLALNERTMHEVPSLLEKGIAANTTSHSKLLPDLYVNLAFYTWFYENDYEKAAELYEKCVREIAGCPPFASRVAAFVRAKQGRFEIALKIWLQRFADATNKTSEEEDDVTFRKIEESAKLTALSCAIDNYYESEGDFPDDLTDLLGISVSPCDAFDSLSPDLQMILTTLGKEYDLGIITHRTLTSSFDHNPFVWDKENEKLKTQSW